MPKSHPPYAAEFRQQMIELVRAGRNPNSLAREFACSAQAIRNWVRQEGIDAFLCAPGPARISYHRAPLFRVPRPARDPYAQIET